MCGILGVIAKRPCETERAVALGAHALEVRVPFVDSKLREFVLPLQARLKLDSRLPKLLLTSAATARCSIPRLRGRSGMISYAARPPGRGRGHCLC